MIPAECAPAGSHATGPFFVDIPKELAAACPSVVPLLDQLKSELPHEAAIHESGTKERSYFPVIAAFYGFLVLLIGATFLRSWRQGWRPSVSTAVGIIAFAAALTLRGALPFSLGNWYAEVLPADGPMPGMRFGPGFFAWHTVLRAILPWNETTFVVSQVVLGALAIPLLQAVMRELQLDTTAILASLVLLIFAPFHARLSATASEHVFGSTLCLGMLFAWLRACRTGDWVWGLLATALLPAAVMTRIDLAPQACALVLWPFLADKAERQKWAAGHRRWIMLAGLLVVVAITGVLAYHYIVIPSKHPRPEWDNQLSALRRFMLEFSVLATTSPRWISMSSFLLAAVGAVAMAWMRPLLLVRLLVTFAVAFGSLGRTMLSDRLVGTRYFMLVIPLFLIASGVGFQFLIERVPLARRSWAMALGLAGLAIWTGWTARPAYQTRYAFQDEYAFLRDALAKLPEDCTVYQLPVRTGELANDLDCCLETRWSPLTLKYPHIQLKEVPENPASALADKTCVAYYESVVCDLKDTPQGRNRAPNAVTFFQGRCAEVRRTGHLQAVAETTVSPLATVNFFDGQPPHVGLYRWTP